MKYATIVYLPPPDKFPVHAFLKNLHDNPAYGKVITYSDTRSLNPTVVIDSPDKLGNKNRFARNNCAFLFATYIALENKVDRFLYLEADCRVFGSGWDSRIFSSDNTIADMCGTPIIWNYMSGDCEWRIGANRLMQKAMNEMGVPVGMYGMTIPGRSFEPMVYPNGAVAIYSTEAICSLFPNFRNDIGRTAMAITAWDYEIGMRMHRKYGNKVWGRIDVLPNTFSGYKDEVLTLQQRRDLLTSGKVAAMHQEKGDWIP